MPTYTQTCHFQSLKRALNYYADQDYSKREVERMVKDHIIFIGEPELKEGERLELNSEGRYVIVSPDN